LAPEAVGAEASGVSEAAFQQQIKKTCEWMNLAVYHTHDSRRSQPGFPDLVIAGANGVLYRELKTETGRVTPMQQYWLDLLVEGGADAAVWRPHQMNDILVELRALGRPAVELPAGYGRNGLKIRTAMSPTQRRMTAL
jgi:hypothetical protein